MKHLKKFNKENENELSTKLNLQKKVFYLLIPFQKKEERKKKILESTKQLNILSVRNK